MEIAGLHVAASREPSACEVPQANYVLEHCASCPELVNVVGEAAVANLREAAERVAPLLPVSLRPLGLERNDSVSSGAGDEDEGARRTVSMHRSFAAVLPTLFIAWQGARLSVSVTK